jgi:N-dimethylarginine dimethylaminohydrolase
MCPPTYYTVRDVKNPFMKPDTRIDSAAAARQWTALGDTFARLGVDVQTIEAIEDFEDMVFTANQVFVGTGTAHSRFIVPSQMRHESRRREVPAFVNWFGTHGFDAIDLGLDAHAGEFLEGHGDLLWRPDSSVVFAGYGFRSSASGVERFAHKMEPEGIAVVAIRLADPCFYHLDTCFAPLNTEAALYYPGAFTAGALAALRSQWRRLHEVTREEALRFACNGAAVNGHFVVSYLSPALRAVLTKEGLAPLVVDASEFEKAGGGVFCLKNFF